MKGAIQQLRNSLGAIVLALLLAFVIWIAASLQTDQFADRRVSNVPVQAIHQPGDTVFVEPIVDQVVVTVRARESVLADLRASSFQATLDLSGVQTGEATTVPISVTCTSDQVRIESIEPQSQIVHLDAVRTMTRTVTIQVLGRVATGYQSVSPVPVPEQVRIRGPEPTLSEVVSVTALVNVEGAKKNVTETVGIQLLDADGKPVPGLEMEPAQVVVQVPVLSLAEYKPDVDVVPDVRGEPAPGYRKGDVLVRPATVTLEGPSGVLDKLPDFLETMPITITGATETVSRQSPLTVPANVNVVEVSYVTVTVQIVPILGTRPITGTVELLRVPPGAMAIPNPIVVTVTLEGPDAKLSALKTGDLLIVLDLRGYALGIYQIKPEVLAPEGVRILSVDPEMIVVVLELLPTPTTVPTPPLTPMPTPKP
jgi:YbbR domain-containing protein